MQRRCPWLSLSLHCSLQLHFLSPQEALVRHICALPGPRLVPTARRRKSMPTDVLHARARAQMHVLTRMAQDPRPTFMLTLITERCHGECRRVRSHRLRRAHVRLLRALRCRAPAMHIAASCCALHVVSCTLQLAGFAARGRGRAGKGVQLRARRPDQSHPVRVGQEVAPCNAGWDTVLWRISCRVGYRARWDTMPRGIPCRMRHCGLEVSGH